MPETKDLCHRGWIGHPGSELWGSRWKHVAGVLRSVTTQILSNLLMVSDWTWWQALPWMILLECKYVMHIITITSIVLGEDSSYIFQKITILEAKIKFTVHTVDGVGLIVSEIGYNVIASRLQHSKRRTIAWEVPWTPHGCAFAVPWWCSCMPASACWRLGPAVPRTHSTFWWRTWWTFLDIWTSLVFSVAFLPRCFRQNMFIIWQKLKLNGG